MRSEVFNSSDPDEDIVVFAVVGITICRDLDVETASTVCGEWRKRMQLEMETARASNRDRHCEQEHGQGNVALASELAAKRHLHHLCFPLLATFARGRGASLSLVDRD